MSHHFPTTCLMLFTLVLLTFGQKGQPFRRHRQQQQNAFFYGSTPSPRTAGIGSTAVGVRGGAARFMPSPLGGTFANSLGRQNGKGNGKIPTKMVTITSRPTTLTPPPSSDEDQSDDSTNELFGRVKRSPCGPFHRAFFMAYGRRRPFPRHGGGRHNSARPGNSSSSISNSTAPTSSSSVAEFARGSNSSSTDTGTPTTPTGSSSDVTQQPNANNE